MNYVRTAILLAGLTALFMSVGFVIGGESGAVMALIVAGVAVFVSYVLWPTWPSEPVSIDAPALPITVAGVLFDVPPAAIREPVQRYPGEQERIDLVFQWPSLMPPQPDDKPVGKQPLSTENAAAAAAATESARLFVSIAGLGAELPPLERLRSAALVCGER